MNRSRPGSAAAYTADIESTLNRLHAFLGAENMWKWLRQQRDDLQGRSPLQSIVAHDLGSVQRLIDAMPKPDAGKGSSEHAGAGAKTTQEPVPSPGLLTPDEYRILGTAGILSTVELINGRVVMGEYEIVFSPSQTAAAERLGVRVRSSIDAVIEEPALRARVAATIRQRDQGRRPFPPPVRHATLCHDGLRLPRRRHAQVWSPRPLSR